MEHSIALAQAADIVGSDFRSILGHEGHGLSHKAFVAVGPAVSSKFGIFFAFGHNLLDLRGGVWVGGCSYSRGLRGRSFVKG